MSGRASGFGELVEASKPHPERDYINNASPKRYNFPDAVVVGGRHHAIRGAFLLNDRNLAYSCSPSKPERQPDAPRRNSRSETPVTR